MYCLAESYIIGDTMHHNIAHQSACACGILVKPFHYALNELDDIFKTHKKGMEGSKIRCDEARKEGMMRGYIRHYPLPCSLSLTHLHYFSSR